LSKQVHIGRINQDIESGLQSGITAAPVLFINNIRYTGHWRITELMAAIIATSH
jgi:protein-disulfide isomerase